MKSDQRSSCLGRKPVAKSKSLAKSDVGRVKGCLVVDAPSHAGRSNAGELGRALLGPPKAAGGKTTIS